MGFGFWLPGTMITLTLPTPALSSSMVSMKTYGAAEGWSDALYATAGGDSLLSVSALWKWKG